MASPFIWGQNGEKLTPQQVERERLAAALMARDAQATTPVASPFAGLNRALQGYISGRDEKRSDAAEAAGLAGADAAIAGLTGGMATGGPIYSGSMGGQPVADPRFPIGQDSVAPPNEITPGGYAMGQVQQPDYITSLIGTESGGRWNAKNNEVGAGGARGHFGRVQFGQARLQDAMNAGAIPQGVTPEQFMASPELQMAAEQWHFADLESQLAPFVGTVVNGQPMTMGALVAMGHLGGAEGARKYVESGGAYNPSDSFGTSLSDYAQAHGGGNVTMSASGGTPTGGTDLASLLALSADPWVTQKYGGVIDALTGQAIQQRDPLYQAQLAEATRGPGPSEYEARAQAAAEFGLSPEGLQSFILTGQLPSAADDSGFTLGAGQQRFDGNGNLIASGTPEPVDPFAGTKIIGNELVAPDGKGGFAPVYTPPANPEAPETRNVKLADGSDALVQWNPQTKVWDAAPIPQGGTSGTGAPTTKLTETQAKTTLFQTLQTETAPVLDQIETIWSPANIGDAVARSTPIAGNFFTTEEGQIYSAASSAWAEGALRISTGAAATEPEIQRIQKTYFAVPGDTPAVVEFKKGMREMYSRAISASLGNDVSGQGTLVLPDDFAKKYMAINPPPADLPVPGATPSGTPARKKYNPATGAFE